MTATTHPPPSSPYQRKTALPPHAAPLPAGAHGDTIIAAGPPTEASPGVQIDAASYCHLLDLIFLHAQHGSLLALRAASRDFRARAENDFSKSLLIQHGRITSRGGRPPSRVYQCEELVESTDPLPYDMLYNRRSTALPSSRMNASTSLSCSNGRTLAIQSSTSRVTPLLRRPGRHPHL